MEGDSILERSLGCVLCGEPHETISALGCHVMVMWLFQSHHGMC
jgi:hypothetical protein